MALNQPFVVMGDFNMSPHEFTQCDFLNQVNASVVAPDTETFKQAGHASIIDFFVVAILFWLRATRGPSSITTAAVPITQFTLFSRVRVAISSLVFLLNPPFSNVILRMAFLALIFPRGVNRKPVGAMKKTRLRAAMHR